MRSYVPLISMTRSILVYAEVMRETISLMRKMEVSWYKTVWVSSSVYIINQLNLSDISITNCTFSLILKHTVDIIIISTCFVQSWISLTDVFHSMIQFTFLRIWSQKRDNHSVLNWIFKSYSVFQKFDSRKRSYEWFRIVMTISSRCKSWREDDKYSVTKTARILLDLSYDKFT